MTDQALSLSGLGQIALQASDVKRAKDFYRDVLGLQPLFDAPGMAFFEIGGVRLMLGEATGGTGSSILYYRVEDIDACHAHLQAREVACLQAPREAHRAEDHALWLAFYYDSEDNVFALMSERPLS